MSDFNFKKYIEKSIINQFRSMVSSTNCEKVTFLDNSRTIQYFRIEYIRQSKLYTYNGKISMNSGFISFDPNSQKEIKVLFN